MREIILASASPRRKDLLAQAGIPFQVMPGDVDERIEELHGSPEEKAAALALQKALFISDKLQKGLVLGADTIVVQDDEIFGKPLDGADAVRMLKALSGRGHRVVTGIALVDVETGISKTAFEVTKVFFSPLSEGEIAAYVRSGEPEGKAGAYAVQGIGALLVERIEGCYSNVVGLPLMRLRRLMEEFGIQVLNI